MKINYLVIDDTVEHKYKFIFIIILINLITLSMCFNLNVKAQEEEDEYFLQLKEGDELVWKVTELNEYYFKLTFGDEPNFKIGDQIKIVITDIYEARLQWTINTEEWDYNADWGERGIIRDYEIFKDPTLYEDYIFILAPVDDYLQEAYTNLDTNLYDVSGNSIIKKVKSDVNVDYRWEKQFDFRGLLSRETVYDFDRDIIIVRVEGGMRTIPMGFYFIGFIILALSALIIISLKQNKILIR
ncbi:MAG: hypothetical protein ACFE85_15365 [Candidatus Hodarchaeota archaeon]